MTNSLVSVVVPIYNVEKYLNRCIESVVNQTYRNLEIILVDDGSPDNCPAMCDEWASRDSRIKVVHKKNAGLGMARNSGIDNATGEYVFFFDSDDYVAVNAIEACMNQVQKTDADTVLFGRNEVYPDGRIKELHLESLPKNFKANEVVEDLLPGLFTYKYGYGVSAWSKMFSMHIINEFGLRFKSEREIISEDSFFCLEYFSKACNVSTISDGLYFYFKNDKSLSRKFKTDRYKQNDIFLQKSIDYIQTEGLPQKTIACLTVRYHMYMISAMKQLLASNLSKKEKRAYFKEIFSSRVLHSSITKDTLREHTKGLKFFFRLLKFKLYPLCKILLCIKNKTK